MEKGFEMHVISNTHWDREWLYNFQETRMMLIEFIDKLLDILDNNPDYHSYVMDSQTVPIEDYLEVRPEAREKIEKYVKDERLLIGPWYTCPLEFQVGGESIVRNLLLGHRVAGKFGNVMKVGYSPFSYGQCSQMPQIYMGFGIDSILFYHGIRHEDSRSDFIFEGADGTQIFASRMGSFARYNFYFHVYRPIVWGKELNERNYSWKEGGLPFHLCDEEKYMGHYFLVDPVHHFYKGKLKPSLDHLKSLEMDHCTTRYLAYMMGHDSSEPDPLELKIIEEGQKLMEEDKIFHSSLPAWVDKVKSEAKDLVVFKGERRTPKTHGMRPYLFGDVTSTRTRMKRKNQQVEHALQRMAEPLCSIAWLLGEEYPKTLLEIAWKYLLKCHAHDSIAGAGVDQIERDVHNRLDQAKNIADGLMRVNLQKIQKKIDNSDIPADDVLLTVFNPSPYERSEIITAYIDLPEDLGYEYYSIWDTSKGEKVDLHELTRTDFAPVIRHLSDATMHMSAMRVKVNFDAKDLPPLGYRVYHIKREERPEFLPENLVTGRNKMENEHLKVQINANGTLNITHKESNSTFENLHYFEDTGEAGLAWRHVPLSIDRAITSLSLPAMVALEESGPLLARYRIDLTMMVPYKLEENRDNLGSRLDGDGEDARRSDILKELPITYFVTLRRGARSVEVTTRFNNQCKDHRLRVMFPTNVKADVSCAETPFDVVERPIDLGPDNPWYGSWNPMHPQGRFIGVNDGKIGLAIANDGLREYEVTQDSERTIGITLMRAFEIALTTVAWRWEMHPEMELTQSFGEHEFRYLIYPHSGDWADAEVYREVEKINLPAIVAEAGPHGGTLPKEMSFISIEPANLAVSAMKQTEDRESLTIRVFNPTDKKIDGKVSFWKDVKSAKLTDLNEEPYEDIEPKGKEVHLKVEKKKIVTLEVTF